MKDDQSQNIDNVEVEERPATADTPLPKWKLRVRKMIWPLHARFPNILPNPYRSDKEYLKTRDAKDNAESCLDQGVDLKLACVMVSEVFGPSEIETLYEGLEKIGWDREKSPVRDESNITWLKKQRHYGTEGTLRLGWIHRIEEAKKYVGVRYTAEYPKEFSSLLVNITQLTPSVTCLTIGFILSDETAMEYAKAINSPAETIYVRKRRSGSYSIHSVGHVKEDRVRCVRQKFRDLGISWLANNFSGFFSEECERSHFPTAEFLSLEGYTPFDRESGKDRSWEHWPRFVNIDSYFDVWTCTSIPSLRFSFEAGRREKIPNHMTIALRWDALSEDDTKYSSGDSLGSRTYFANERLGGIIPRYALASYLRELLRSLKETRQSLSGRSKARRSVSEVDDVSAFFRRSIGVPSIAREVLALSENDASFRWNATGFTQQIRPDKDKKYEISEGLKSFLGRLARQLQDEDRDTREFLNQLSSAMGTKQSMAAQSRMEIVAIIALIVSMISMIVAAYAGFAT